MRAVICESFAPADAPDAVNSNRYWRHGLEGHHGSSWFHGHFGGACGSGTGETDRKLRCRRVTLALCPLDEAGRNLVLAVLGEPIRAGDSLLPRAAPIRFAALSPRKLAARQSRRLRRLNSPLT